MRRLRLLALAGVLGLALAGCSTLQAAFTSTTSSTPAAATTAAAAEQAYTVAANLETTWLNSGVATKAQAAVAKSLEASVYADVVTARTAVKNNDSPAVATGLALFNQALPAFTAYIASHGGSVVQPK